ncbi:hypothetical protein BAE44_0007561 [Dichanthelium oligosanthes]|uniref:BRI1-KD interacting protein 130 n=1 Tax=Dichanthelium oligosanthes TaxID=888268 RepID=A0A1E5W2D2_9POAL|nr:hypothetical protein BAE44_0007561 [Dichanthelium oligosanthes]
MDGRSCCLERAPVLTPGDNSPTSGTHAGLSLPLEKRCASVDETCEAVEGGNGLLEAKICTGFSKSISLEVKKGLQKCATFPPSGEAQQEDHSCCHADDGHTGAPPYERSVSLPVSTSSSTAPSFVQNPTLKLISAMKGSRQKNGVASPTEDRHVKWAPDVYDPPVTSVCHSVNSSYQRRSKPRKKEKSKQKKKQKGKSKKNPQNSIQNSSALQAPDLGLKGVSTTGGQSSVDDPGNHEAVIMDYTMGNQEAKCGSSFLRESVAKMHFSTAEAS